MVRTWVWTVYEGWWRMFVSSFFFLENSTHRLDFSFNRPPFRHSRSMFDTAKKAADILNRNLFLWSHSESTHSVEQRLLLQFNRATRRVLLLLLWSTISSNTRPPARHNNLQMELCTLTSVASVVPAHFPSRSAARDVVFVPLCTRSVSSQFAVTNLFVFEQFYPLPVALYKTYKKSTIFGYNI